MSPSDLRCAQLSAAIYDAGGTWDHRWEVQGIVCGHVHEDGVDVLAFRGSVTVEDWMDNADAWPRWDRELGFVHRGFLDGMDALLAQVIPVLTPGCPIAVTGHSLGGARARIAAAKLLVRKFPVSRLVTFGSPKPAFVNLARVIQKAGIDHRSYRNCNDPVPLVPGILPEWQHTEPWTALAARPGREDLDPLRDHFIARYVEALGSAAA